MAEEVGKAIMVGAGEARHQVEFTQFNNRRLIRATKNPMDRSTIVSIFPKAIDEYKPTIEPGKFRVQAGTYDNPSILVIGSSSWWKDIDPDQPMMEMQRSSIEVANSIINDYSNSTVGSNMADCVPGLFFVLGERTVLEIKTKYKKVLDEAKVKQDNWYKVLVRLADSLWARTSGNPLAIMDEMRLAARELNFNDKPWLKDFHTAELVRCMACGGMRNAEYPICPTCKAIDPKHPLAATIKFAV